MTPKFDKSLLIIVSILIGGVAMFVYGDKAPASPLVIFVPIIVAAISYKILKKLFIK